MERTQFKTKEYYEKKAEVIVGVIKGQHGAAEHGTACRELNIMLEKVFHMRYTVIAMIECIENIFKSDTGRSPEKIEEIFALSGIFASRIVKTFDELHELVEPVAVFDCSQQNAFYYIKYINKLINDAIDEDLLKYNHDIGLVFDKDILYFRSELRRREREFDNVEISAKLSDAKKIQKEKLSKTIESLRSTVATFDRLVKHVKSCTKIIVDAKTVISNELNEIIRCNFSEPLAAAIAAEEEMKAEEAKAKEIAATEAILLKKVAGLSIVNKDITDGGVAEAKGDDDDVAEHQAETEDESVLRKSHQVLSTFISLPQHIKTIDHDIYTDTLKKLTEALVFFAKNPVYLIQTTILLNDFHCHTAKIARNKMNGSIVAYKKTIGSCKEQHKKITRETRQHHLEQIINNTNSAIEKTKLSIKTIKQAAVSLSKAYINSEIAHETKDTLHEIITMELDKLNDLLNSIYNSLNKIIIDHKRVVAGVGGVKITQPRVPIHTTEIKSIITHCTQVICSAFREQHAVIKAAAYDDGEIIKKTSEVVTALSVSEDKVKLAFALGIADDEIDNYIGFLVKKEITAIKDSVLTSSILKRERSIRTTLWLTRAAELHNHSPESELSHYVGNLIVKVKRGFYDKGSVIKQVDKLRASAASAAPSAIVAIASVPAAAVAVIFSATKTEVQLIEEYKKSLEKYRLDAFNALESDYFENTNTGLKKLRKYLDFIVKNHDNNPLDIIDALLLLSTHYHNLIQETPIIDKKKEQLCTALFYCIKAYNIIVCIYNDAIDTASSLTKIELSSLMSDYMLIHNMLTTHRIMPKYKKEYTAIDMVNLNILYVTMHKLIKTYINYTGADAQITIEIEGDMGKIITKALAGLLAMKKLNLVYDDEERVKVTAGAGV